MTNLKVLIDGKEQPVTQIHYSEIFNREKEDDRALILKYYKRDEIGQIVMEDDEPVETVDSKFNIKSITIEVERK